MCVPLEDPVVREGEEKPLNEIRELLTERSIGVFTLLDVTMSLSTADRRVLCCIGDAAMSLKTRNLTHNISRLCHCFFSVADGD